MKELFKVVYNEKSIKKLYILADDLNDALEKVHNLSYDCKLTGEYKEIVKQEVMVVQPNR